MPTGWTPSRRAFLAALGLAALGAACKGSSGGTATTPPETTSGPPPDPGSIDALQQGAEQLSLLSSNTPTNTGKARFGFDLSTSSNSLITGGSPQVWIAKDQTSAATGPFVSRWYPFTAYGPTHDTSPESPLPGTYVVELDFPSAGNWLIAAVAQGSSGGRAVGVGALPVTDGAVQVPLGSKAISVKTPVATTDAKIAQICTRKPVDHMHSISLDRALKNGKPTVVSFATPLLCESRLCGPVVDEQILAFESVGAAKANFIHVEEFLPGPQLQPPAPTLAARSPAFKAWHLTSEPWMVVIDRQGVIRFRAEGPVTAPEIEAAVTPLI
jgi:hypothetical protein